MLIFFGVLVVIFAVILGLVVLVQNPKGGGLTGSLGGFSNQLVGVKSSTDIMEKGTWIFAAIVGILCIVSPAFIPKTGTGSTENDNLLKNIKATPKNTVPDTTAKMPTAPAATAPAAQPSADTTKK
jgi:preprotein translocase subunit SecG